MVVVFPSGHSARCARVVINEWKYNYNRHRRHSGVGYHRQPATLPLVPTERLSLAVDQFLGSGQLRNSAAHYTALNS
jgi:hypothetical protein